MLLLYNVIKETISCFTETAESSIQDEGGDHSSAHVETRQSKRNKSSLDPVPETDANVQFDNKFELADESSWVSYHCIKYKPLGGEGVNSSL